MNIAAEHWFMWRNILVHPAAKRPHHRTTAHMHDALVQQQVIYQPVSHASLP